MENDKKKLNQLTDHILHMLNAAIPIHETINHLNHTHIQDYWVSQSFPYSTVSINISS